MKNLFKLFLLTLLSAIFVVACSDDEETITEPEVTEFVAEYSDFAGYRDWTKVDESTGKDPMGRLGTAHEEDISTRISYVNKSDAKLVNGEWPVGTILVKDMYNTETNDLIAVMAMAKRGGDFNKDHNGWEWFVLNDAEKKIESRDANLMNGMCNGCHGAASENDYSFVLESN